MYPSSSSRQTRKESDHDRFDSTGTRRNQNKGFSYLESIANNTHVIETSVESPSGKPPRIKTIDSCLHCRVLKRTSINLLSFYGTDFSSNTKSPFNILYSESEIFKLQETRDSAISNRFNKMAELYTSDVSKRCPGTHVPFRCCRPSRPCTVYLGRTNKSQQASQIQHTSLATQLVLTTKPFRHEIRERFQAKASRLESQIILTVLRSAKVSGTELLRTNK